MQITTGHSSFQTEARRAITDLQAALGELVSTVAASSDRRLSDIADALDIDTKLAWKLNRIVELADPLAAGVYVPGAAAGRIVVDRARARGIDEACLDRLTKAFAGFERLQAEHAGDRRTLDTLLAAVAGEERGRNEAQARKGAYHAGVALWGVRVTTRLMSFIIRERRDQPGRLEAAHVAGTFGVTRTRPNVPWRVGCFWAETNEGAMPGDLPRRNIDPDSGPGEPPILWSHTSPNVPELVSIHRDDTRLEFRLGGGPIGKRSLFDLVTAERIADAGARWRTPGDDQLSVGSRNRTPAERVILEMTVERSLYGRLSPEAMLFGELWDAHQPTQLDHPDRMPLHEKAQFVGEGLAPFRHRCVPRHHDLMSRVFGLLEWDADAFDTYRVDLTYPPSPTILRMIHPLPTKRGA